MIIGTEIGLDRLPVHARKKSYLNYMLLQAQMASSLNLQQEQEMGRDSQVDIRGGKIDFYAR